MPLNDRTGELLELEKRLHKEQSSPGEASEHEKDIKQRIGERKREIRREEKKNS